MSKHSSQRGFTMAALLVGVGVDPWSRASVLRLSRRPLDSGLRPALEVTWEDGACLRGRGQRFIPKTHVRACLREREQRFVAKSHLRACRRGRIAASGLATASQGMPGWVESRGAPSWHGLSFQRRRGRRAALPQ